MSSFSSNCIFFSGDERIGVLRYPNGFYYNHYGYQPETNFADSIAGPFDSQQEAEEALRKQRPLAHLEGELLAMDHLPTPAPKPKAKASASVICPEIPSAQRHNYRITDDHLGVGTPSQRYANNVSAIRLLKQLESESRLATPEEQDILDVVAETHSFPNSPDRERLASAFASLRKEPSAAPDPSMPPLT